jgi:hypothetical protein
MPWPIPNSATPSAEEIATVRSALASFGVRTDDQLDEKELSAIAAGWDDMRSSIDRMYATPSARYAEPALRFYAEPHAAGLAPALSPPTQHRSGEFWRSSQQQIAD